MPNGIDKNYVRLRISCGVYRQRFGEWPSQARMEPIILWDLARLFDDQQFAELAARIQLRTRDTGGLSVGGGKGVVEYEALRSDDADEQYQVLAQKRLGLVPRHE